MTDVKATEADSALALRLYEEHAPNGEFVDHFAHAIATARAEGRASRRLKFEWRHEGGASWWDDCIAAGETQGFVEFLDNGFQAWVVAADVPLNEGKPFPDEPTARKAVEDAVQAQVDSWFATEGG